MRRFLVLAVLVFFVASTNLLAAPSVAPWKGFYIGGSAGGAAHTAYWTDPDYDWFGGTLDLSKNGMIYGVVAGYNFQPDTMVYGLELDLNVSSVENGTLYSLGDVQITDKLNSLYMLKGRVGIPAGKSLLFATVGVATGKAEHTWIETGDPNDSWDTFDNSQLGYTIGAGVEHSFSNRLSFKVEFNQVVISPEANENNNGYTMRVWEGVQALRFGLNFHP